MNKEEQVQKLLEQGLYHYGIGENAVAVDLWKQVLELEPENETAREYLEIELGKDWEEKLGLKTKPAEPEPEPEPAIKHLEKEAEPSLEQEFNQVRDFLAQGEIDSALEACGRFLEKPTSGWLTARAYYELAKMRLVKKFITALGSLGKIPYLKVNLSELVNYDLSEEEGFVLSLVNGEMSLEDILSLSPTPPFKTFHLFWKLTKEGLVGFKEGQ